MLNKPTDFPNLGSVRVSCIGASQTGPHVCRTILIVTTLILYCDIVDPVFPPSLYSWWRVSSRSSVLDIRQEIIHPHKYIISSFLLPPFLLPISFDAISAVCPTEKGYLSGWSLQDTNKLGKQQQQKNKETRKSSSILKPRPCHEIWCFCWWVVG